MTERSPLEAIFFAALEKGTAAERAAFLDEACAGNKDLRRRVERLLAAHPEVGNFLERPVAEAANVAAFAPPDTPGNHAAPGSGAAPTQQPEVGELLALLAPSQRPDSLGRLGHHEVLEVVGKGGMGIVLRAFDEKLHRVVAIKVLAPQLATSAAARQRFGREARAAAAVTHDNVIPIHAVEDAGPAPYLVMQFLAGSTLQEKLDRTGFLPLKEVLRIGMQVAAGLAAAHAQGLVHRDVKPANILLENGVERVKITDFGLARAADDASLTQSGVIAGTPAYMSPEQANGEHVDGRSDLFSLGSVLYTLCTGHAPFRGSTTMAVLKRVCEDTPRPPRQVNPDIPDWLGALIARLHAKDPAQRFQTAAEVAELLGQHLAHVQQPEAAGPVSTVPDHQARWKRAPRIALLVLLLLGVAVLGAGVAGYWVRQHRDEAQASVESNGDAPEAPRPPPRPPSPSEEWASRPSPLDALNREARGLPENAPPGMLALLGQPASFPLSSRASSHWMAQTSDGRLLAVPSGASLVLFKARDGTLLRTLTSSGLGGATDEVYRPAFRRDGERLAAGSSRGFLHVWDVATGQEKLRLTGHTQPVWCVAYDPASNLLVSADAGGTIKVWNGGQPLTSFAGHARGVIQLAFRPDGKRLATTSLDGTCKLWDPANWKEVGSLPGDGKTFQSVTWSRDGKLLAAGNDAEAVVWNADTGAVLHPLKTPAKGLLAFSPDGLTLFTARHDCSTGQRHAFSRWDVKTGTRQATCPLTGLGSLVYFHLSADGKTVFVSEPWALDARVHAYDAETGREQFPRRGHLGAVRCVAFSPDGRTLATGSADTTVRLWDLAGWKSGEPEPPFRTLEGHVVTVWSLAFSPDGRTLATTGIMEGRRDRKLILWDTASGRPVHDLMDHQGIASLVAFSPDGSTVAAGSDNRIHLWDAQTGKKDQSPCWNDGPVLTVAFSPDGRLLACGDTHTIQVIDRQAGRRLHTFRGEKTFINLAFSPDSKTLAATTDGLAPLLRLWDVATGQEQAARAGHTWDIFGLAFHPGGRLAATAGWDGTVRLWDVTPSDKEVRNFDLRAGRALAVAFSPEGRHAAVGLENGTIAILRVAP